MQTQMSSTRRAADEVAPIEADQGVLCPVSGQNVEISRKRAREEFHIHGGFIPPDNHGIKWLGARDLQGCNQCGHKCVEH
jgi:hypothetical protein